MKRLKSKTKNEERRVKSIMKKRLQPIFFTLHFLLFTTCLLSTSVQAEPPRVRVLLLEDAKKVTVQFEKTVTVQTIDTHEELGTYDWSGVQHVKPTRTGLVVGNRTFKVYGIRVHSSPNKFKLNGAEYRGALILIREKNKTLKIINDVNIDDYVKGVLPYEVAPDWPLEALKAHAVVSRSFALVHEIDSYHKEYSLKRTVASQVYAGTYGETDNSNRAVDETQGEVLVCEGSLVPTYFHANCGGHTTRAETVWKKISSPALQPVICPYCAKTKHYEWEWTVSAEEIKEKLNQASIEVGDISTVLIERKDESGRAVVFRIVSSRGFHTIHGNTFRLALGPELLRSTLIREFEPYLKNGNLMFYFKGLGWGHGVGLCQWGAKGMAEHSFSYSEILHYYFTDVSQQTIY